MPLTKDLDLIALDSALTKWSRPHESKARAVEFPFRAGLTAGRLHRTSAETVKPGWRMDLA
jgi:hypothetical protein